MKRKFKLFATVASLCLCLALMAFGVYAASSVTYTATGKVSYEMKSVFVTITNDYKAYLNGNSTGTAVTSTHAKAQSYTGSGDTKQFADSYPNFADESYTEQKFLKQGDKVVYTTTLTNDGEQSIYVKYAFELPDADALTKTVVYSTTNATPVNAKTVELKDSTGKQTGSIAAFQLESGKKITVTLTIVLSNAQSTVEACDWKVVGDASYTTFA